MLACDFLTVDTVFATRLYVLFFIDLANRRVHLAGRTQHPSGMWVAQRARRGSEKRVGRQHEAQRCPGFCSAAVVEARAV